MDSSPRKKRFWMAPFVVHATRGLIRDQTARRRTMFVSLVVALVLLFGGSTFLQSLLIAHPVWFIIFWFICAWLTLLAVLLALFDLLAVRAQARAVGKALRMEVSSRSSQAPPSAPDEE
jgi:protein-S-isoprenylcysteine O-methyltransferase Ste14